MKDKLLSHRHHIVLALFLFIHALTCAFTTYYGDDYYYAAFLKNGADYMLSENIFHYMQTNGRALVHLIDELLLGISFWVWRAASVAVMGGLAVVSAKLAARSYRKNADHELYKNALIAVCALLAVTDLAILRQSVYWATGALNYLFPSALTLWFVYLLRKDFELDRGNFLLILPAFFASATTEQASAASLLAVLWILVTAIVHKRRIRIAWLGCLATSVAGFLTLILAPGSAARTQYYPEFYAMPLFERIGSNISKLAGVVCGPDGMYLHIIALLLFIAYRSMKKAPPLTVLSIAGIVLYGWRLSKQNALLERWWVLALFLLPLAAILIYTVVDYFKNRETDNLYFIWGTLGMQCAMLISPEYGPRTLTMSVVLLTVFLARAYAEEKSPLLFGITAAAMLLFLPAMHSDAILLTVILLYAGIAVTILFCKNKGALATLVVVLALIQFATVSVGYAENLPVHAINRENIKAYDPETGEPLVLYYLPNYEHKYTMPYDDPYHQHVLMLLCGFPSDTQIVYKFVDE